MNSVQELRAHCLAHSTRPFKARGSAVKRCSECLLASFACVCEWRISCESAIEFILIMHRNELYKTTNSGRLLADMFPAQTRAFLWSRTQPDPQLLTLLSDSQRNVRLLFPDDNTPNHGHSDNDNKPLTIVLLDGTWKQAARMARLTPWLRSLPRLSLCSPTQKTAYIRKASDEHQLSTAQAVVEVLVQQGEVNNGELFREYFSVFNHHCMATRRCIAPEKTPAHYFLEKHR